MKRFFIGILVLFCIIGCNGSGGSSGVINDKSNTYSDNTDNDTTDDGSVVSGLKFKFSNPQRVLVVKRNVSTVSQDLYGEGESTEVEVIQVNDEGVSDVAKLDVKDVKKGDDGYLYMTLNTSSEGSYLVKANAKTNEYQYIDKYPIPSSEKGHNQNLQWSEDVLYFKAEDKENSKTIIRMFDGTETKTVVESSKINDWVVCPDSSVYFTDDESIYKSDSTNGVVKVGGGKKVGWIQRYEQTKDKEVRACVQDDEGYAILTLSDSDVTNRQSLDGNLEEEQLRIMNPDIFVEVNDVKLLFTSYGGFGQMFQVYPYKDGNNLEVVVDSLTTSDGIIYITGKSNDGGQVFWEVFISQEDNWYRGLRPGYTGFEEQQMRFTAAATNDDYVVYYTSIDDQTSNVIIGEYNTSNGTTTGEVIDATEVISDVAM